MTHSPQQTQTVQAAAVLLAAGEGARLGRMPKSLMTLDGQSLLIRQIAALKSAGVAQIVVVTGYFYGEIERALTGQPVTIARNLQPEDGQQSSVRLGLEQLQRPYDFALISLADQPLLNSKDFSDLIRAFCSRRPDKEIRYPVVHGQRGNPVSISAKAIAQILTDDSNRSCRSFIQEHPKLVEPYQTDNEHFIIDIDTAEDIAAFNARTGLTLTRP